MSFWSKQKWHEAAVDTDTAPVQPWDHKRVEEAGYLLAVGPEVFLNGKGDSEARALENGEDVAILPGMFAFILTEENVRIPLDAIGFISVRASIKFKGLVNVSGFQVNPGHEGNLIFAVFNAGPMTVHVRRGDKIFSLWIADLDRSVQASDLSTGKISRTLTQIDSDILSGISGEALTAYQVNEKVEQLKEEVRELKGLLWRIIPVAAIVLIILGGLAFPKIRESLFDSSISETATVPNTE